MAAFVASGRSPQTPPSTQTVDARGVAGDDLRSFGFGAAGEQAIEDLVAAGEGALLVGIVPAPGEVVRADHVTQLDADVVLLEANEDMRAEEVAGQLPVREARPAGDVRALEVVVVDLLQVVGDPAALEFDRADGQS